MNRRMTMQTSAAPDQLRADRFRLVSGLAGDLAHEIRNPLHSMVINLEVMRRYVQKGAADAALERAGVLEVELARLHALVDQMLHLLRPEREPAQEQDVSILVLDLVPILRARARAGSFDLVPRFAEDVAFPAFLQAQRVKLALLALFEYVIRRRGEGDFAVEVDIQAMDGGVAVLLRGSRDRPEAAVDAGDGFDVVATARGLLNGTGAEVRHFEAAGGPTAIGILLPRHAGA
jgi:signal transduction histidine kinase